MGVGGGEGLGVGVSGGRGVGVGVVEGRERMIQGISWIGRFLQVKYTIFKRCLVICYLQWG